MARAHSPHDLRPRSPRPRWLRARRRGPTSPSRPVSVHGAVTRSCWRCSGLTDGARQLRRQCRTLPTSRRRPLCCLRACSRCAAAPAPHVCCPRALIACGGVCAGHDCSHRHAAHAGSWRLARVWRTRTAVHLAMPGLRCAHTAATRSVISSSGTQKATQPVRSESSSQLGTRATPRRAHSYQLRRLTSSTLPSPPPRPVQPKCAATLRWRAPRTANRCTFLRTHAPWPVLADRTSGCCARSAQLQKRVAELERLLAERPQEAPAAPAAAACAARTCARYRRSCR
jgi:hypothetical protein